MNHLWIAYDALIVTIGTVNLAALWAARPRKAFLGAFSLFYTFFTAGLLVALSRGYVTLNVSGAPALPVFLSYGLGTLLSCAALLFVVLFYQRLLNPSTPMTMRVAMLCLVLAGALAVSPLGVRYEPQSASYVLLPGHYAAVLGYLGVFSYVVYLGISAAVSVADEQDRAFCWGLLAFASVGYLESGIGLITDWQHPTGRLDAEAEEFLYSSIPYLLFSVFLTVYLLRLMRQPPTVHEMSAEQLAAIDLSAREREVLQLVLKGLNNKLVARELNISVATVKTHLHKIFRKTNVSSRFELARRLEGRAA